MFAIAPKHFMGCRKIRLRIRRLDLRPAPPPSNGELSMQAPWIRSCAALPREGQPVEFIPDDRDVAIDGTYAGQAFRSRWTEYDLDRVGTWRLSNPKIAANA
jgi:hypothetical protein